MASRRVVIVVFPGVHSLDACGPLEVFTSATRWLEYSGKPNAGYRLTVAARGGGIVRTSSRLGLLPDADLDALRGPVDTLVVAEAHVGPALMLKRWTPRGRGRIGKIRKRFSHLTIVVREVEESA